MPQVGKGWIDQVQAARKAPRAVGLRSVSFCQGELG